MKAWKKAILIAGLPGYQIWDKYLLKLVRLSLVKNLILRKRKLKKKSWKKKN
jgi:hypothetical protein